MTRTSRPRQRRATSQASHSGARVVEHGVDVDRQQSEPVGLGFRGDADESGRCRPAEKPLGSDDQSSGTEQGRSSGTDRRTREAAETGELTGTTRVEYRQLNANGDERLFEGLGLTPIGP